MLDAELLCEGKDEAEPFGQAETPDDRIETRRKCIAAQVQAEKHEVLGSEFKENEDAEEIAWPSLKQMEKSEKHMTELKANGADMVTNLLVVADARESKRRAELRRVNRLKLEKLENEAKSGTEKFSKIMKKWTEAETKVIHQELRDDLRKQQQLCWEIIENKNKLIDELQQELKSRNDHFVENCKTEAEEMDLLIEKLQELISGLKKDYRKELDLIENSFSDEWKDLLEDSKKKWEQQRKERSKKELDCMLNQVKMLEEHEALLDQLRVDCAKEYRKIKTKLEADIERLEQDLQAKKAAYLLNQEKLEHNTHMLKKYEQEYTVSKAEQIKKLTRRQATQNYLKKKCAMQEKQTNKKIQVLTNKYKRLTEQQKDIQNKIRHFAVVDAKRYKEIWLMNEDEAKELVCKALEMDQFINEQVLGLTWSPPPLPFTDHSGPKRTLQQVGTQNLREEDETQDQTDPESCSLDDSDNLESSMLTVDHKTVKRLLELFCDELGFLIESKVHKLLFSTEKNDQMPLKLDFIFSAIGIKNEEDINEMTKFFLKYKQTQIENVSENDQANLIHPNDLLRALHAFTAQYCKASKKPRPKSSAVVLKKMNDSEIKAYWNDIANVIPESKFKVWKALEAGLKKYHTELTTRSKLLNETQQLRQQNFELHMLLHQYQSPPSRMMQQ
ncbi:dynein regulatory complex protein 1-like [Neoarius graeffei]|uniref:dynein regulatory complex protein 1-like n=1 Tax=Neoarius graeffei TaxID=443677 RepID=UPI00298D06F8|nr:dynein regulatory complex protein 1-like [Neoarius graeffei]